jgi:hypothetical protein
MIKVYCDSYGRVRLIGTGIKDNEIVRVTGDFFYLSPEDTERFKRIGHANIYELMFKNDDGDYVIFELTNATGDASIIEITKDKKEYIKDNGDGLSSALELISDNDVPFANLENSIKPTENNAPFVQHGNEPKDPPSLLNLPKKRKNDWAEVINEMASQFFGKHGKLPTEAQGWDSLCNTPPVGYEITTGKDKGGEDCLIMAGKAKTLSRSAFNQRWSKRYIKQSPNHQT